MRPLWRWTALTVGAMLLTACAHTPPPPQPDLSLPAPAAWTLAPLPHEAAAAPDRHWWSRWDDAVLLHLQAQAVRVSPTLAAAATRMARARHEWTMADAAAGPAVQGMATWQRSVAQPGLPASTTVSAGVQASWEIDLWGGLAAQQQGARERAHASAALSGAARVGLEAEVARQYTGWRICQQFTALSQTDAQSRATTARLTALQVQAGLAPATASALTEASAAQGRMQVTQQQARCDAALRGLSELTGLDVAALQAQLKTDSTAAWDAARVPALQIPNALPATLLAQRPDVWAAQRAVLAASADVQATDADQRPRLSLSGQLMPVRSIGVGADATVWSIGPVQLSVPLWDGGRRQSASAVSRVAYDEALSSYRASVRTAVREVESALIELHSIRQRETDAATATERLTQVLKATTERQRAGLASVLELEDVRRTALNAQLSLIELARDRAWAWIDLYRVLGGGWEASSASNVSSIAK